MSPRTLLRLLLGAMLVFATASVATFPPLVDQVQDVQLPGGRSRDLGALHPSFRDDAVALVAELRAAGWPVYVRETVRGAERQAAYVAAGWSQVDHSRHQDGVAVDLGLALPWTLLPWHVQFYRDLRDACEARGLECGVSWSRSRQPWATFDLGWDPGHVEARTASRPGR